MAKREKTAAAVEAVQEVTAPEEPKTAKAPKAEKTVKTKTKTTKTKAAKAKTEKQGKTPRAPKGPAVKVFVEYQGRQVDQESILSAILAQVGKAKKLEVYVKPEDGAAYYVADGETGKVTF